MDNSVLYHIVSERPKASLLSNFLTEYEIQYIVIASLEMSDKWHTLIRIFQDHQEALSQFVLANQIISIRKLDDNESNDILTITE